jgi:hypothetical protein
MRLNVERQGPELKGNEERLQRARTLARPATTVLRHVVAGVRAANRRAASRRAATNHAENPQRERY